MVRHLQRPSQQDFLRQLVQGSWPLRLALRAVLPLRVVQALPVAVPQAAPAERLQQEAVAPQQPDLSAPAQPGSYLLLEVELVSYLLLQVELVPEAGIAPAKSAQTRVSIQT
jgi:hypothetical protein